MVLIYEALFYFVQKYLIPYSLVSMFSLVVAVSSKKNLVGLKITLTLKMPYFIYHLQLTNTPLRLGICVAVSEHPRLC